MVGCGGACEVVGVLRARARQLVLGLWGCVGLSDFRIWVIELRRGDGCGGRDTGWWRRRGGDVQAIALAGAR